MPPKKNRTDPWDYDRQAYKGRNVVERVFNRMKHHRKAATRYDRLDETFLANLQLILIAVYLKKHSQKPNYCKHTLVLMKSQTGLNLLYKMRRYCCFRGCGFVVEPLVS